MHEDIAYRLVGAATVVLRFFAPFTLLAKPLPRGIEEIEFEYSPTIHASSA